MSFSSYDLFGDISDIDGFADDDDNPYSKESNKRKNSSFCDRNFSSTKRIRKDNWHSKNSNVLAKNNYKNESVVKELYSGIRLTKPLVSSEELKVLMQGRTMIKLSALKSKINKSTNDINFDWVTIGVIVSKATKVSKNGKDYSIWNLSDLTSENLVSFFLFGNVHEKHWKLSVGSVIGLLNASFMNNNKDGAKKNDVGPITIDDPDKLLHIGTSKDLGYCKAVKKNGDICGTMIMKADDEFCLYHIKNAFRKFSSKRAEIQTNFSNKEPEQYHFANNYVPNASLNKNNIVVEMKTVNKSQMKDKKENEMKKLSQFLNNPLSRSAKHLAAISKSGPSSSENSLMNFDPNKPIYPKDIFEQINQNNSQPQKKDEDNSGKKIPVLAKGYQNGQMIDLNISLKDNQIDFNKQKAIEILKKKQGQNDKLLTKKTNLKPLANTNKNKKMELILKRVNSNLNESNEERQKEQMEAEKEKAKLLDEALKRKSINGEVVKLIENEAQEQHFKVLEKRERYENRLADVKELDCKVVTCKSCKYTASSQSDYCKSQNHDVVFHMAKKRFFACKYCNHRRFTFDSIFPSNQCQNCGSTSFEKTSIIKIKTETKLGKDLLVRGEEIKFLNSLK